MAFDKNAPTPPSDNNNHSQEARVESKENLSEHIMRDMQTMHKQEQSPGIDRTTLMSTAAYENNVSKQLDAWKGPDGKLDLSDPKRFEDAQKLVKEMDQRIADFQKYTASLGKDMQAATSMDKFTSA